MKILQVFLIKLFLGGKYFLEIFYWNFLSFRGFTICFRTFQAKNYSRQFTLFICENSLMSKSQSWTGTAVLRLGKRLRLGPLVLTGLTQDRGPDSVFRKGLGVRKSEKPSFMTMVIP